MGEAVHGSRKFFQAGEKTKLGRQGGGVLLYYRILTRQRSPLLWWVHFLFFFKLSTDFVQLLYNYNTYIED